MLDKLREEFYIGDKPYNFLWNIQKISDLKYKKIISLKNEGRS